MVGEIGKLAFDAAGDLWIPFRTGLVVALSPAELRQVASGQRRVRIKVKLAGGALTQPQALAFSPEGDLWIANPTTIVGYTAAALSQQNPAPSVVVSSNSFEWLGGLALDAASNLWVADSNAGEVYEFTRQKLSTGGSLEPDLILQSTFQYPRDVAFDHGNNLWVAYGEGERAIGPGGVQMFAAADLTGSGTIEPRPAVTLGGQSPCSILTLCWPSGLAFDQSGDLWVATGIDADEIYEFTPAQLESGGNPLAHLMLVSNSFKQLGRRENFGGVTFLTFGPVIR